MPYDTSWNKKQCTILPTPNTLHNAHIEKERIPISKEELEGLSGSYYLYASLSSRIYEESIDDEGIEKEGWILVYLDDNNLNGFKAGLYRTTEAPYRYVIAYTGTTGSTSDYLAVQAYDGIADIMTDLSLLGMVSNLQPSCALVFYKEALRIIDNDGVLEAITGHSLGGALAQYTGLYTGIKTITFNTAPLPFHILSSACDFHDKYSIESTKDGMKRVLFHHEDKLVNIMLPYDPVSMLSTAMMSIDTSDRLYLLAVKSLFAIPPYQTMDYLITGKKIYLPVTNLGGVCDVDNHAIDTIKMYLPE